MQADKGFTGTSWADDPQLQIEFEQPKSELQIYPSWVRFRRYERNEQGERRLKESRTFKLVEDKPTKPLTK